MRVILYGHKGMAGHLIYLYLTRLGYKISTPTNSFRVESSGLDSNYDLAINCIGVLKEEAEANPDKAEMVNSLFPHKLSEIYPKVIQLSTDCVFNGEVGGYYVSDAPDAKDIYGRSKAKGELVNSKDLTIRTSIIGPEIRDNSKRRGLLNWVVTSKNSSLPGWINVVWSGITTLELAKCIHRCITEQTVGIIQATTEPITKFGLLQKINKHYRLNKYITPTFIDTSLDRSLVNSGEYVPVSIDQQLKELYTWTY